MVQAKMYILYNVTLINFDFHKILQNFMTLKYFLL